MSYTPNSKPQPESNGSEDKAKRKIEPMPLSEMRKLYSEQNPDIVQGVLRRCEVCNIIAPPKVGKSFLVAGLAMSLATGQPWLTKKVERSRVLIIDNELQKPELVNRFDQIGNAMGIHQSAQDCIDVVCLRGEDPLSIDDLHERIELEGRKYDVVILDALYRALPDGTIENDNNGMSRVYGTLIRFAERWRVGIFVIHHSSKGDQSGKAITDLGSGAGSISRAADSHLAIRPHAEEGLFVLESVTRSHKSPDAISIRFDYPLWVYDPRPAELRKASSRGSGRSTAIMREERKELALYRIPREGACFTTIKGGWNNDSARKLVQELVREGKITSKGEGRKLKYYRQ